MTAISSILKANNGAINLHAFWRMMSQRSIDQANGEAILRALHANRIAFQWNGMLMTWQDCNMHRCLNPIHPMNESTCADCGEV